MAARANQRPALTRASVRTATKTVASATTPAPQVSAVQPTASSSPDPEDQRVQEEFVRLRQDAAARQAFYDDLLDTVARVRAGKRDESPSEEKPLPPQTAARPAKVVTDPADPKPTPEVSAPPVAAPPKAPAPQTSLGPYGSPVDSAAYQRVVRWAKANDAPIALALGVAWMESRLNTNAPRGTSGEVGMFQIMPERCRLEGWPSERLTEPEFNAWLGTLLLARYYREEGSVARAAAKYVAGPGVFDKKYSKDMWDYIT
jgi:soluble lytic murein transglycosylase-like protein